MSFPHVLISKGRFLKNGADFSIANVYASYDLNGRQDLDVGGFH
jgi:hypothetical protein